MNQATHVGAWPHFHSGCTSLDLKHDGPWKKRSTHARNEPTLRLCRCIWLTVGRPATDVPAVACPRMASAGTSPLPAPSAPRQPSEQLPMPRPLTAAPPALLLPAQPAPRLRPAGWPPMPAAHAPAVCRWNRWPSCGGPEVMAAGLRSK
eukprot:365418-Chlamydomonas_euryale.AAC.3